MSIRIFENILAYRRTRDGYAFTVIKIEISQNCPRMLMQSKVTRKEPCSRIWGNCHKQVNYMTYDPQPDTFICVVEAGSFREM